MYKVKRAIVMAAGLGSRLHPVTLKTPKPLVKVNGVRMIDTIIKGLRDNGIFEIYVVVGYLRERFSCLEEEYPGLKIINNPYYDTCNNISSLYVAREYLEDVIILDGDQIVYNSQILSPYFERSGYNCIWTEQHTDEWLLSIKNGIVCSCSRNGGEKGWQLFSVSRWTAEDGQLLKHHLELEFEKNQNHGIFWDDIALFCYPNQYHLGIYEMKAGDIVEIDSLEELAMIDTHYKIEI